MTKNINSKIMLNLDLFNRDLLSCLSFTTNCYIIIQFLYIKAIRNYSPCLFSTQGLGVATDKKIHCLSSKGSDEL